MVDTMPTIHQAASQPKSTHKSKKNKSSATTQPEIQFSHNDTSKAANSNSPMPPVLPAPVVNIPSHVGMMSTQGTSESRQTSKKYIVKLFDHMVHETVHDENPRNTFGKCTEQQLCTPRGFQRFADFLCDTTENNSENGYRTSDKHTVPLCIAQYLKNFASRTKNSLTVSNSGNATYTWNKGSTLLASNSSTKSRQVHSVTNWISFL